MDKNPLSEIKRNILKANPDIPESSLTDAKIEAAVVNMAKKEQAEVLGSEGSQDQPNASLPKAAVEIPPASPEVKVEPQDRAKVLNFVLKEISGNSNELRGDNPELASNVDMIFGLNSKDTDKAA